MIWGVCGVMLSDYNINGALHVSDIYTHSDLLLLFRCQDKQVAHEPYPRDKYGTHEVGVLNTSNQVVSFNTHAW